MNDCFVCGDIQFVVGDERDPIMCAECGRMLPYDKGETKDERKARRVRKEKETKYHRKGKAAYTSKD